MLVAYKSPDFVHSVMLHCWISCSVTFFPVFHFQLIPAIKQKEFLELFRKYFNHVRDHLVVQHKAMHKRERRNRDIIFSKGELNEERQTENEAAQKTYDKLLTNTSTLAVSVKFVLLV